MTVFERLKDVNSYHTNSIRFEFDEFLEKISKDSRLKIDCIIINKKDFIEKSKVNYAKLNVKIKNDLMMALNLNKKDVVSLKYKKVEIDERFCVLFLNPNLKKSKVGELLEYIKGIGKDFNSLKVDLVKALFGLMLKLEIINVEYNSGRPFSDNEYNDNIRYILECYKNKSEDYIYDVLEIGLNICENKLTTEMVAKRYKSKELVSGNQLVNSEIKKYGKSKIKFLETKREEKIKTKLFYYQLVDRIIKEKIFKKYNISYGDDFFNYNYKFAGKNKMVSRINHDEFLDVTLLIAFDEKSLSKEDKSYFNAFISLLLINSNSNMWSVFGVDKDKFISFKKSFEALYEKDKIIIKDEKKHKIKVTKIIHANSIDDLSKVSNKENIIVLNIKDEDTETSFKFNGEYTDKIKTTLDLFKKEHYSNIDNFDFYTRLKFFNLMGENNLTLQGVDISFKDIKKGAKGLGDQLYPNDYVQNLIKKVSDEILIKSVSKNCHIRLKTKSNEPLCLEKMNYKLFYFKKKKDASRALVFAVVMDVLLEGDQIIIKNKKSYLPRTENDLMVSSNFEQFIQDYSFLKFNSLKDIYDNQFIMYSDDGFLIRKYSSKFIPRLIGNMDKPLFEDMCDDGSFSKSKDDVFRGIILPSVDSGAGVYMDVRDDFVLIKSASSEPMKHSMVKGDLLYKVSFEKDGCIYKFDENNIHIKNYFKLFSYDLIKFKNTSKKSFIEKVVEIEILN